MDAVKDTKHLQKNLIKYQKNLNGFIQEEYDNIRVGLAELLRTIDDISKSDDDAEIILLLSKAKVHMERYDIVSNGILDNLIRKDLITNEMATSLMNDSSYAYEISKHLIAMAETIFTDRSTNASSIHEEMAMDTEDIKEILEDFFKALKIAR